MNAIALPPEMERMVGRISDVDSHEHMPAQAWVASFGSELRKFADAYIAAYEGDPMSLNDPEYPGDVGPVGPDIAAIKGPRSPGAKDPTRRVDVMDALGIKRQLMFPSGVGIFGLLLQIGKPLPFRYETDEAPEALGQRLLGLYADWALDEGTRSDRIRPVMPLYGRSPAELYDQANALIKRGAPALWMPSGVLPGGRSPASTEHDRLWALLAESNTVLTLHGGGEGQFFHTREWKNAAAFDGYRSTSEFEFDPWSMSVYHLPSQNFVTTMVLGGVFERHPRLRLGVIEVGSHWVGPMLESIDLMYNAFQTSSSTRMERSPSEYIRSNVRVSTLIYEDIDVWLERHPGLDDILCFSTDYPHPEGGRNAEIRYFNKIAPLGEGVVDKFFVTNGQWLLPETHG